MGRRNITTFVKLELTEKYEDRIRLKGKDKIIKINKSRFTNIGKAKPTDTQTNTDDDFWGIEPTETKIEPVNTQKELAKMAGTSHGTKSKFDKIKDKIDEDTKQKLRTGEFAIDKIFKEVKKEETKKKKTEKFKEQKLPTGTYNLVYCDPPWRYDFAETENRKIENQYPTMSIDDICNMTLPNLDDNTLLLMWATSPKLLEALKVIEAWGFTYKTHSMWDKVNFGMGYWFRGQHELLIVATKGKVSPPDTDNRNSSVYVEKRTKHSRKPHFYYDWIEKAFPNTNKIELFSRNKRDGWEVWGNE
jgi:N6-adenosine-specific RNA methylase IME4